MTDSRTLIQRPIRIGIIFSVFGETMLLVFFGMILYPEGSWVAKFLWSILFCGVGMGSAVGALVLLFVVDRFSGWIAIALTALISIAALGIGCNLLCLYLDSIFHFFGGGINSGLYMANGILLATVGGLLMGWLQFTPKGNDMLELFKL